MADRHHRHFSMVIIKTETTSHIIQDIVGHKCLFVYDIYLEHFQWSSKLTYNFFSCTIKPEMIFLCTIFKLVTYLCFCLWWIIWTSSYKQANTIILIYQNEDCFFPSINMKKFIQKLRGCIYQVSCIPFG